MPPNYTDSAELLKEIKAAEAHLTRCKREEEITKETLKERKAATVKAVERLRMLSRGDRGLFGESDDN